MKFCVTLLLLLGLTVIAATINVDFALGGSPYFGVRIVPRVEFWRVESVLDFPLGIRLNSQWFSPMVSPLENLKYLNVDLGQGGIRFNALYLPQAGFSNLDFHNQSLVAWAFDGSLGAVLGPESALFFKTSFFNACIDSEGQHHVGLSLAIANLELSGFTSSRGYGFGVAFEPLAFFFIPNNGFRFAAEKKNIYLMAQYLDEEFSISMGWIKDEEWLLLGTHGLEARLKFGSIAIIMKLQRERWYAGFSFPIVW